MIESYLDAFLAKKVNPDVDVLEQGTSSQEWMLGILENKLQSNKDLPAILNNEHFLFGSAVRGTKPAPFDDIDMMLILDGSLLNAVEGGVIVGTARGSGATTNALLSEKYLYASGFVSSQEVLQELRGVLNETYSQSEIRKDGQAINVWLGSYGFGIDVVPAFRIESQLRGEHYYIPYGTGSDMWQPTNPWSDLHAFEELDARLNGVLRPAARLMRKWNELSNAGRLSGFHIDALVYRSLLGRVDITTKRAAVTQCLSSFGSLLKLPCPQFSGFKPDICHSLTEEKRFQSIKAAERDFASISATGSLSLPSAMDAWNGLFGNKLR